MNQGIEIKRNGMQTTPSEYTESEYTERCGLLVQALKGLEQSKSQYCPSDIRKRIAGDLFFMSGRVATSLEASMFAYSEYMPMHGANIIPNLDSQYNFGKHESFLYYVRILNKKRVIDNYSQLNNDELKEISRISIDAEELKFVDLYEEANGLSEGRITNQ